MILDLRAIWHGADFRKSDWTLIQEFRKHPKCPGHLSKNGVFLFVSCSQDQLMWVFNTSALDDKRTVVDTRRWRITGGSWNPDMLQNYAHAIGIHLLGKQMFQQTFAERRARMRSNTDDRHEPIVMAREKKKR